MAHLIFQTAFPGDVFLAIPLVKRVRAWDPGARLVLACRPGLGEFFLKTNLVDEVIEIDKRSPAGRAKARARLRSEVWDAVFVPHESIRTALWMWHVRARLGKIGFHKWWNFIFFSRRVVKPVNYPDALRQLSLLTPLDSTLADLFATPELDALRNPEDQSPEKDLRFTPIPEWASMKVRTKQESTPAKKIFIAPGSVWPTKRWTAAGYVQLAQRLLQAGFAVDLVGSQAERDLCATIASQAPGVQNRAGETSLAGLTQILATGDALVCNDSGAMHAAATCGLPTVAIFGPTTLALGFRPWNAQSIVVQKELSCRPCGKHGAKSCPIGTHECMEGVSEQAVFAAVLALLQNSTSRIP